SSARSRADGAEGMEEIMGLYRKYHLKRFARKACENAIRNEEENAMKRLLTGCALVALLWTAVGTAEAGQRGRFACGGVHAVRANRATGVSEMFLTEVALRKLNADDPVTIERITIRDPFGEVVYDGGP